MEPNDAQVYEFENKVTGGRIPTEYIPSVDKGFQMARGRGPLAGVEVGGAKMIREDGSSHAVDSSDLAFQVCARTAFRQAIRDSNPYILEPIMKVEVEVPTEFQGPVSGDISSRRGYITDTEVKAQVTVITAEVPLANMFGYSTSLRSLSQGQATFSMEFGAYRRVPGTVQEELVQKHSKERSEARK
jgi:elongation factor G